MPSGPIGRSVREYEVCKRDSMYQSSREIRKTRKQIEGKMNQESMDNKKSFLSFDVVDSLPRSCQMEQVCLNKQMKSRSIITSPLKPVEYLDLSFRVLPEEHSVLASSNSGYISSRNNSADNFPRRTAFHSDEGTLEFIEHGSENDQNARHEKDMISAFTKSSSVKVGTFSFSIANAKHRFGHLKKVLDPIMKYKSTRTLSLNEAETFGVTTSVFHKTLLTDTSSKVERIECDESLIIGNKVLITNPSSAHLYGTLKLEFKLGVAAFEFSVKDPDLVLLAKTWKTDNAFNWVYTFHRKKSHSTVWSAKDRRKHSSPTIGQMHVSCDFCSEVNGDTNSNKSMVTEFILYDTDQARRDYITSIPSDAKSSSMDHDKHASNDNDSIVSASYPLAPSEIRPQHEIAAIVIQTASTGKDGLKELQADETNTISTGQYHSNINVVTPSGRHGLSHTVEDGPSSLLDRWRSNGGCDCGGWDMGCPLSVFENCIFNSGNQSMILSAQGKKEKLPALSIKADGKGQYSVQFHPQLSALQAFSICIAMLHGLETPEKKLKLYPNSLNLLLGDEVRNLIEVVNTEKAKKSDKIVEEIHPCFNLDPPFSPMSR
ncbi:hypothetical protein DsansV1_C22g0172451 [Dioscorea sansibarensis]